MRQENTAKPSSSGAALTLAALHRAAADARKIAIQTNTGIVIRRDGQLVEISAAELIAEAQTKTTSE